MRINTSRSSVSLRLPILGTWLCKLRRIITRTARRPCYQPFLRADTLSWLLMNRSSKEIRRKPMPSSGAASSPSRKRLCSKEACGVSLSIEILVRTWKVPWSSIMSMSTTAVGRRMWSGSSRPIHPTKRARSSFLSSKAMVHSSSM